LHPARRIQALKLRVHCNVRSNGNQRVQTNNRRTAKGSQNALVRIAL
jgi:hypothetical protein